MEEFSRIGIVIITATAPAVTSPISECATSGIIVDESSHRCLPQRPPPLLSSLVLQIVITPIPKMTRVGKAYISLLT